MVGCASPGGRGGGETWRGSLEQAPGTPRAGEPSAPAPPAAPSPVALPGEAPGGGDERRGDTGTRTPRAESLSRRLLRRAGSGEGHRGRRGKGGGRAPPRVFRAQAAGSARTLPFFGIGLAGQVTGAASPSLPPAPFLLRDAAGAAGGGGKGAVQVPCWVRGGVGRGCFEEGGLSRCLCSSSSASLGCAVRCH